MVLYGTFRPGYAGAWKLSSNLAYVNLLRSTAPGCNALRAGFSPGVCNSTTWNVTGLDNNGQTVTKLGRLWFLDLKNLSEANGITFFPFFSHGTTFAHNFNQMHNERAEVILNVGGMQDTWIQLLKDNLNFFDPGGLDILNEPHDWNTLTGNGSYTGKYWSQMTTDGKTALQNALKSCGGEAGYYLQYKAFIERAASALHAIKPSVILSVNPCPFWDSRQLAANPPIISGPHYFSSHLYYDGGAKIGCPMPDTSDTDYQYWIGNYAAGKTALYNQLNTRGPGAMINAGLPVNQDEIGINGQCYFAYGETKGHFQWLKDIFDYCKSKGVGYHYHNFGPYGTASEQNEWGVLTADWKQVNQIGLFWAQNLPGAAQDPVSFQSLRPVTFTVNGIQYPGGTMLTVPRGSTLQFSVPEEI